MLALLVFGLLTLAGWLGWRLQEWKKIQTVAPSSPTVVETPVVEAKEPAKPVPVKTKAAPLPQETPLPKSDSRARRLWNSAKRKAKAVLEKTTSGAENR